MFTSTASLAAAPARRLGRASVRSDEAGVVRVHELYGGERWHKVALLNPGAIVTACHRVFITPMDIRSSVPSDGSACLTCTVGAAA